MIFTDRIAAAQLLLQPLKKWKSTNAIVLAIPRGGVPLAAVIAKHFQWQLDLIMVKKIGMPGQPELAIGAVSPEGEVLDPRFHTDPQYLTQEIQRIRSQLMSKYFSLTGRKKPCSIQDKTVILVDDGIATGNTMAAAVDLARHHGAKEVVVAVPVASESAFRKMVKQADAVICLAHPADFISVGQYYEDFSQVDDDTVHRLFCETNRPV